MNKSPLTSVLTGALGLSALVSLILCYLLMQYSGQTRFLQPQLMNLNMKENAVRSLAADTVEYSKTHPDMAKMLQGLGLAAQNPMPATKPTR